ncbi:uncharacterized protein C3orf86-like [Equus przewalskii]|uniref:Uncharacterized protein C3orf86-like n=1 Tax=Equus przewalskii TaxID=9798 RepID=A0ABM4KUC7_EQUPR
MSKSQPAQGKKPLDTFFWVNEITGEITYPSPKADAPAASPASLEKPGARPGSQRGSVPGAPPSARDPASTPAQTSAPPPPPQASLKDIGSRNCLPSARTHGLAKAGARSPAPFLAIPVAVSPPEGALPSFGALGPAPPPPASTFPPSPPAPWAFTSELKNVLTGNE